MENMKQTPEDIKRVMEEGLAVPTPIEALQDETQFEYLLKEAGRIARENPEDGKLLNESLDIAEEYLSLDRGMPNAKELLGSLGVGTAASLAVGIVAAILTGVPTVTIDGLTALMVTGGHAGGEMWEKNDARKRLKRVREALGGTVETA